ncbi:UDP-glucose 4-epimerase GalE [Candidatus Sumerlaeota bacterium]|nr:UDP-glucose 4-epimerase GalE [Candidatus Sumerlaeota bacterium]
MSVLVVGGAGYIGSVVVEQLIEADEEVVVLDNLSRGHRRAVHNKAVFVEGDMANEELVREILQQYNCDVVMHFSALSLVGESVEKPMLYYENNVAKGIALVKAMLSAGVNKLIFSSTAAVYGIPEKVPLDEDDPTQPINPYGRTKLQFEQFLADCSQAEGLNYISLRYFNAAGASERFGEDHRPETHLIPIVLQTALGKRNAVTVFGDDYPTPDGTCIRDYIHVVDLATAHLRAMNHLRQQERCAKIFNLGNNKGFSVLEIIKVAQEVTGKKINYKIGTRRPGDPPVLIASSHRLKKELGWQLKYPEIHQIIDSAWCWYLKHPDGYPE